MRKKLFIPLIVLVFLIIAGGVFWWWQIEKEYSEMKKFIEEQTKGALTPKDIGLEIPETNFENITTLPTGEKVSSEIISISVREGVDEETIKKIVESIEGTIVGKIPDIGGYYIKLKSPKTGDEIKDIIDELRRNPNIDTASPERFYEPKEGILPITDIESNELSEKNKWGFENIGILDAWKVIRDNKKVLSDVVVAVIDTGVGLSHPDLKENIMLNVNGYQAWDFGDDDADVNPDRFYPSKKLEYFFLGPSHGTAVAGIVASVINGQEINGVAPLAKIFPLKCFPSVPKEIEKRLLEKVSGIPIPEYSLANAVFWATKAKVDIINLSLGDYYSSLEEFQQTLLYKILNNLTLKENIIVVASAGNKNKDASNHFPSAMEGVISVGATNYQNQRASFSNFSLSDNPNVLEISAPGELIYTTFTEKRKILSGYSHTYDYFYGTSASTPFVSGVVALLKQLNKDISSDQIRETIFSTADIIQVNFHNDSKTHLWRKVNAEKSVREILGIQKLTEEQEPEILKRKEEEAIEEEPEENASLPIDLTIKWESVIADREINRLLVTNTDLFASSFDGYIYTLDKKLGNIKGKQNILGWPWLLAPDEVVSLYLDINLRFIQAYDITTGNLRWEYRPSGRKDVSKLIQVTEDKIYIEVGNFEKSIIKWELHVLDSKTGKLKEILPWPVSWWGDEFAQIKGDIAYSERGSFIARAFNFKTGEEKWVYKNPIKNLNYIFLSQLSEETFFVWGGPYLFALDTTTGAAKWIFECKELGVINCLTTTKDTVYIGGRSGVGNGFVSGLDAHSGNIKWVLSNQYWSPTALAVSQDTLYIGTDDGRVVAIKR